MYGYYSAREISRNWSVPFRRISNLLYYRLKGVKGYRNKNLYRKEDVLKLLKELYDIL